jgi:hypothetical protein
MDDMLVPLAERPVQAFAWPEQPYKGLNFYAARDAPLFCERDEDIHACGKIASHFSTKLLILHGRTGAGKSSFIRAGLFPRYFSHNQNFFCLLDSTNGEPLLIRSTADPVSAVIDVLRTKFEEAGNELGELAPGLRRDSLERLSFDTGLSSGERAQRLLGVLRDVTMQLPGTLVLAIDQAEEVFTLLPRADVENVRRAYFDFLESLCFEQFDVKLLLVLRTEVYGQFADRFRFEPDLSVSTVRSGLTQFMLHGIREPARLVRAIERPTLRQAVAGIPKPPFDTYGFSFSPQLPERIANDVIEHSGESSTLPILQLVCLDLYQTLKPLGERDPHDAALSCIDERIYEAHGRVQGAISRFIYLAISRSVKSVRGKAPDAYELEAWLDALSYLVVRQEGGAQTSLLLPERELCRHAPGIERMRECLAAMAADSVRLLRSTEARDPRDGAVSLSYSLGHDSLAPTLYRDDETRRHLSEARKRRSERRRLYLVYAPALALLLLALSWALVASQRGNVSVTLAFARVEPLARLKLLTLLRAEEDALTPLRPFGLYKELDTTVREVLARTPIASFEAASAGGSFDGEKIALVSLTRGSVVLYMPRTDTAQEVAPDAIPHPESMPPMSLAVGFLPDARGPVVYDQGHLKQWFEGRLATQDLKETVPEIFEGPRAPMPEIAAGNVRLTQQADVSPRVSVLAYDPKAQRLGAMKTEPQLLPLSGGFWPTVSETHDKLATLNGDSELRIGLRSDAADAAVLKDVPLSPMQPDFVRSMAFVSGDAELLIRDNLTRFVLVEGMSLRDPQPKYSIFQISARSNPQRTQEDGYPLPVLAQARFPGAAVGAHRSAMAVARTASGYRVAWAADAGISVFDTTPDGKLLPLPGRMSLLPSTSLLQGETTLQFSTDGNVLTLLQHKGSGVDVRVWDLSHQRHELVNTLQHKDMVSEICRTLARDPTHYQARQRVVLRDVADYPSLKDFQPCEEKTP